MCQDKLRFAASDFACYDCLPRGVRAPSTVFCEDWASARRVCGGTAARGGYPGGPDVGRVRRRLVGGARVGAARAEEQRFSAPAGVPGERVRHRSRHQALPRSVVARGGRDAASRHRRGLRDLERQHHAEGDAMAGLQRGGLLLPAPPPIIFESGFSLHTREFFSNFGGICGPRSPAPPSPHSPSASSCGYAASSAYAPASPSFTPSYSARSSAPPTPSPSWPSFRSSGSTSTSTRSSSANPC